MTENEEKLSDTYICFFLLLSLANQPPGYSGGVTEGEGLQSMGLPRQVYIAFSITKHYNIEI